MNPIGIHALVWTGGWTEPECRYAVGRTKEAGFDLIEIPLLDPDGFDAALTKAVLEEHGVAAACSLGLRFDADVSSSDTAVAARGEKLLNPAVDATAVLGARFLGGVTHSAMGKYLTPPTSRGRRHCIDALRRVAERAAEKDVVIGIEAVNRYESNLINTAAQALELAGEIGAGNVVVHLDSYHMNIEEDDPVGAVRACGERLGYVHIGEGNRGYLGSGTVAFKPLFAALAGIGYQGPLTFESFSSVTVSADFTAALAIWRDPWQDGFDVAVRARRFIEAQLSEATKR
jgi:D-psicose/D-tagatose/L-ribulose 3-epimerase